MKTLALENIFVERLVRGLPRSSLQINLQGESDAELIRLLGSEAVLALTTDTLAEELETGLYSDPYLIGWMTVLVNASDLAAAGADPLGILLSQTFPPDADEGFVARLQCGIQDASRASRLPILGGDTNFSSRLQMGATAVGLIPDGRLVTRRGCRPGDRIYTSGPLGGGAVFALTRLEAGSTPREESSFLPSPRIEEGKIVRRYANGAIDTSDGLLAALDELARINGIGVELNGQDEWLHPEARTLSRDRGFPEWLTLAGPHGEFELVFAIPDTRCDSFFREAHALGWDPLEIGRAVVRPGVRLSFGRDSRSVDTARIRNLFHETGGDVGRYIRELLVIHGSAAPPPRGSTCTGGREVR